MSVSFQHDGVSASVPASTLQSTSYQDPRLYTLTEEDEDSHSRLAADSKASRASAHASHDDYEYRTSSPRSLSSPPKRKPVPANRAFNRQSQTRPGSQAPLSYLVRNLDENPHSLFPSVPDSPHGASFADLPADQARELLQRSLDYEYRSGPTGRAPSTAVHARNFSDPVSPALSGQSALPRKMTSVAPLQRSNSARPRVEQSPSSAATLAVQTSDKTQASAKISSFFGWGASKNNAATPTTPIAEDSPTTISSDHSSPEASTFERSPTTATSAARSIPKQIDVNKANGDQSTHLRSPNPLMPRTPAMSDQVVELEEELRDLSTELALSIRREMELEDEVERLQNGDDRGRRTSDYFSDSASSSVKDAGREATREEDLQRQLRKGEQERAQLKIDLAQKLEQERSRRREIEEHTQQLEAQYSELEKTGTSQSGDRTQELERRLTEEREMKQNYEDLLHALKGDLTRHQNERDNLRDEVVPQLRARVDGLEAEATQYQTLQYEHARMQQELQAMKGGDLGSSAASGAMGLSRSASAMRRSGGLSRSNSVKGNQPVETREALSERVKDIEAQRDALHKALKTILLRQNLQDKRHEKQVQHLKAELQTALESASPRRKAYAYEVKELRQEVNHLRGRAEDALESKWQCEKNLAGLKMNLDRAEQETTSLRDLLKQNNISDIPGSDGATSESLEKLYAELRQNQSITIQQLKGMSGLDSETDAALNDLLTTLDEAKAERDIAMSEAQHYQEKAANLSTVRTFQETENSSMATQLEAGAARIHHLNAQIARQLQNNQGLRERLSKAVQKGEEEQKQNADRITQLQSRLRSFEDRLVAAQSESEERVSENEDVVRSMHKADNPQVLRFSKQVQGKMRSGSRSAPRSPLMPSTPGLRGPISPRLGGGESLTHAMKTESLERKVRELEAALTDADSEMQEVVQRMNAAQIEVLELQGQRDEALRSTKNLQEAVVQENKNMGGLFSRLAGR